MRAFIIVILISDYGFDSMDLKDNVYTIHLGNGFNRVEGRKCFIIFTVGLIQWT